MLQLTKDLRRATAARERALRKLKLKTQRAAIHLQALLDGEEVKDLSGRTYRAIHVTWIVQRQATGKMHPTGADALAVAAPNNGAWTLLYDPRQPLRELDQQAVWEVDLARELIDDAERVIDLPTTEILMTFAKDYASLVKKRTEETRRALDQLTLAIKEIDHAKTA